MNREIIDTLLSLFDEGIAENLPGEVFRLAVHFLEGLIDRHRADRDRCVANDPFTCFMNVFPSREVHHGISAPAYRPDHFLDFFFDGRGDRGVANVRVDLNEEVPANDHRLTFRMIHVRGNNRAATGHFVADELGRDDVGNAGAPGLTGVLSHAAALAVALSAFTSHLTRLVFTDGDKFHLWSHDPFARVVDLGDVLAGLGTERLADMLKPKAVQFGVGGALAAVVGRDVGEFFHILPAYDPGAAERRESCSDVDRHRRVGIGT